MLYEVCINGDPELTLTYYGKVRFGYIGFSVGKSKTVDFSETIAVCDMQVGRYR